MASSVAGLWSTSANARKMPSVNSAPRTPARSVAVLPDRANLRGFRGTSPWPRKISLSRNGCLARSR